MLESALYSLQRLIMIGLAKWRQLKMRMQALGIDEQDIEENFIIGSGQGGQKLHKTASCVQLRHKPSGIILKCQATRSRSDNRFYARRILCEKIDERTNADKSKRQQAIEKIRRQKRKRSKRAKEKVLADKSKRSQTKQLRKPPTTRD